METTGLSAPTPTLLFPLTGLSGPLLCWNLPGNKGKDGADTISGDVGLQSLFISITELLLTSKARSAVSEAFPGYVNSTPLCYLFLSSPLSSPAPRVGFFSPPFFLPFFFFPKTSQGSHLSLLSQCSPLLQHKKEL